MRIGIQFQAPSGLGVLEKGKTYHFLENNSAIGRVLCVHFSAEYKTQQASIVYLNQKIFESALQNGEIVINQNQAKLPPWLEKLEGVDDLTHIDALRRNAKKQHSDRVEQRVLYLTTALVNLTTILSADNVDMELNKYARECVPPQNETRFRLWFYTYLCFGRDIWSLLPSYIRAGNWDRNLHPDIKMGRESISMGEKHGHTCTPEMIQKIEDGYLKYSALGKSMKSIYVKCLRKIFGCVVAGSGPVMKKISHPKGEPFPSYWQFRYRVNKKFGLREVQTTLLGKFRYRTKKSASKGRFSESVSNLMERVEADGFYLKEVPRGFLEGSSLQPLCVVRSRCVASGMLTGIGFALGKERSEAYRMMLFSMAVPKSYFCSLFGLNISEEDWPSQGLPPFSVTDRGPGAKKNLIEEFEKQFPIRELTPSYMGQSKATIESSNPKDLKSEGQPNYFQSDLNPVALAKREIIRLIKDNASMDMSERMLPDWDRKMVQPSPIGIWNHLASLFRTSAQPMKIEDAVRTFLTPVQLTVFSDGVWYKQQKFDSDSLRETGVVDKVASGQCVKIKGYVMDMCVRHIWAQVGTRIVQLDAKLSLLDDDEQIYLSLHELEERAELKSKISSEFKEHQKAAEMQAEQTFFEQTGEEWDAGSRKAGKPKRNTATARRESAETRNRFSAGE